MGGAAPAAYAADSAPPGMNAAAIGAFRMTGDAGYVIGPFHGAVQEGAIDRRLGGFIAAAAAAGSKSKCKG